jgi:hypothetical protein
MHAHTPLTEETRLAAEREEKIAALLARLEETERRYLHAFQEARRRGEGSAHGSALFVLKVAMRTRSRQRWRRG